MGADAIGINDVGRTESSGIKGSGGIKANNAITRKYNLYKAVNVRFSSKTNGKAINN